MKKNWIRTLLEEPMACRKPVAIQRKKLGVPPLYCVPLALSDALLLAALYTDFQFDGYQVVRLRDISSIQDDQRAVFHAHIMAGEQVLPSPPHQLPLTDFAALLAELAARGEPVAVEDDGKVFLLGAIEKAGKNKLRVRYIAADGRVDARSTRIPYEDIAAVRFGGRYLRLVARYAIAAEEEAADATADTTEGTPKEAIKEATKEATAQAETPAAADSPGAGKKKPGRPSKAGGKTGSA
jgi:hypothetical protein